MVRFSDAVDTIGHATSSVIPKLLQVIRYVEYNAIDIPNILLIRMRPVPATTSTLHIGEIIPGPLQMIQVLGKPIDHAKDQGT
jgi:hypothetical protein